MWFPTFSLLVLTSQALTFVGKPNDCSHDAVVENTNTFNAMLKKLEPGDELSFPNQTYCLAGGVSGFGLHDIVIRFNGTLKFSDDTGKWPKDGEKKRVPALYFEKCTNITFTSSGKGLIDGQGKVWWGLIRYAEYGENRPRLFEIYNSTNILVENLILKDSAYWTFWAHNISSLEVRYTDISARIDDDDTHKLFPFPKKGDITAFNTDGFDVAGKDVYIHDCNIWNQDDCIAVKDDGKHWTTENMVFERINASGLGISIGSICNAHVRNITFRDINMHRTVKGIYMKFRPKSSPDLIGLVENITYENIYMEEPEQWPIWIGPAQQSDSVEFWQGHPCSLCWPQYENKLLNFCGCGVVERQYYRDILLKNITIVRPSYPAGMIKGSKDSIENIRFEGVKVVDPKYAGTMSKWFEKRGGLSQYFVCEGVKSGTGVAIDSDPVPYCFNDQEDDVTGTSPSSSFSRDNSTSAYIYERDNDGCACAAPTVMMRGHTMP